MDACADVGRLEPGRFRPQCFVTRAGVTQVNISQNRPRPGWKRPAHLERQDVHAGLPHRALAPPVVRRVPVLHDAQPRAPRRLRAAADRAAVCATRMRCV
eukprot:COSAG01_NODE_16_length_40091_cov_15.728646_43_plen_100_part_00